MSQDKSVQSFDFATHSVRIHLIDNEPWFVAVDVCKILEIANSRDALRTLDDDERGVGNADTLGGKQKLNIVNESGLYALIFKSRKPVAKKFRKWVTNEVLPSIRKTGQYQVDPTPRPRQTYERISPEQYKELCDAIHAALAGWVLSGEAGAMAIHNRIRASANIHRVADLPSELFPAVMAMVAQIGKSAEQFLRVMCDLKDEFIQHHISAGAPWTPHKKRDWNKRMSEALPERPDWLAIHQKLIALESESTQERLNG
jgi:prophage antirepressor-like protein